MASKFIILHFKGIHHAYAFFRPGNGQVAKSITVKK